jgi:hypothetical protein
MSEEHHKNPCVVCINTMVCCAALACLIAGIVFLTNPEGSGLPPAQAKFQGTILAAVGGTVIGLQVLIIVCVCCCMAGVVGISAATS